MAAISFPINPALDMGSRLLDSDREVLDDTVSGAVAVSEAIVGGGAKAKCPIEDGHVPINLSFPTVVRGSSYTAAYPSNSVRIELPVRYERPERLRHARDVPVQAK